MSVDRSRRDGLSGVNIPNVMLKTLFKGDGLINFCHLNVASVKPKIDELRSVFLNANAHVVSFSETWLKSYNTNKSVEIDGYKLLRCDRRLRKSGGVAIYVKDSVKYRFLTSSECKYDLPQQDRFMVDFLMIELVYPDVKILFGVFYKAVKTSEFDVVRDVVSKYASDYEHVVLAGDFNENLLSEARQSRMNEFKDIFSSNGLNILNNLPTHYQDTGASLLDLIVTRGTANVKRMEQLDTGMSLHDMLVMSYLCPSTIERDQPRMCQDLRSIDEDALFVDACLLPWEEVLSMADSDSIVAFIAENLRFLMDKHAPLRPIRERLKCNAPWFTKDIAVSITERNSAKRYWRMTRTSDAQRIYRTLRNQTTALITKTKSKYYDKMFENCRDSKSIWSQLRALGIGKDKSDLAPPFTADDFNKFLYDVQSVDANKRISSPSSSHPSMIPSSSKRFPSFSFHDVSYDTTKKSIMQITSSKWDWTKSRLIL